MHRSKLPHSITSSARRSNGVDHELEFSRLLYRQIGGLGAFEDLVDVTACTVEQIVYIGPVDD
ncbi:hypothetical protein ABIE49_005847 [Bradyrhizobium sp. OAE829]